MSLTNPNIKINVKIDSENGAKKSVEFIGNRARVVDKQVQRYDISIFFCSDVRM
jgi:hypothetical protein